MRREREEVLRETVVDLARDARALLGDRAPELGSADRAPEPTSSTPKASTRRKSPWETAVAE